MGLTDALNDLQQAIDRVQEYLTGGSEKAAAPPAKKKGKKAKSKRGRPEGSKLSEEAKANISAGMRKAHAEKKAEAAEKG